MTEVQPLTPAGRTGLAALVENPRAALVAFDFDGTLAPIVDDPDQARAHPDAVAALVELAERVGHVAVVTGRPAAIAVDYAGLRGVPGLAGVTVLGHYGLERWEAGTDEVTAPPAPRGVEEVRSRLPEVLSSLGVEQAYVEDKGASLGVHTRRLDDPEEAFQRLRGPLQELADETGLVLEPGRLVLELRPPGVDKGGAVRGLVDELGVRTVVFCGDDLGDLAAFDAVDELRDAGLGGLLVCSGSTEEAALAERADVVVDGPPGVVAFVRALSALLDRR